MAYQAGFIRAGVIAALAAATAVPALAQSGDISSLSCDRLWYERNRIYKDAGYCFHTQRGIRAFGNAGCQYDREGDVPLSAQDRRDVQMLVEAERAKGCQ
jgi:hypothetical protein